MYFRALQKHWPIQIFILYFSLWVLSLFYVLSLFSLHPVWLLLPFSSSSSPVPWSQIRHRVHSRVILFSSFTTTSCTLSNLFSWRKRQRVETREKICLFSLLDLNSRANRTFCVIFAVAITQFILVDVYYFFGWK